MTDYEKEQLRNAKIAAHAMHPKGPPDGKTWEQMYEFYKPLGLPFLERERALYLAAFSDGVNSSHLRLDDSPQSYKRRLMVAMGLIPIVGAIKETKERTE